MKTVLTIFSYFKLLAGKNYSDLLDQQNESNGC